jgi:hypothetical protein
MTKSLLNLKPSPSFRAISRGTYYKVNTVRDPPPPCGYYNVNYELIDKSNSIKMMSNKHTKSRKIFEYIDPPFRDLKEPKKGDGYVDFKKQSPRQSFEKLQLKDDPHERRFDTLNLFPSIFSKSPKMSNKNFDKTSPRKSQNFKINMTPSIYEPNYEAIKTSLSKTGVSWNKALPRPPIISIRKERDLNSSSIDYHQIDRYLNSFNKYAL